MLILARFALIFSFFLACKASIVGDIIAALERAVGCDSCHALLAVLKPVAILGDSIFSGALVEVCKAVKIQDDDVCEGLLTQQGPILAHDLRSISAFGQTATNLCSALFGLCQPPAINKFTVPFPSAFPKKPKLFTSGTKTPFQVVHFSDVHVDRMYSVGSDANCTKPICCRNFADHTGPIGVPAGPLGSRGCDTPTSLIQSMLKAVSSQNTQFSIFTGDVVEAAVWLVDKRGTISDLQTFNNEMATLLDSPVFPAIGNHEIAPINSFPRSTTKRGSAQWVFDTLSEGWESLIGSTAANEVKHMSGSYATVAPGTNLRIISLNTNYWYRDNFYLFDSDKLQPDPNGILAFAVQQLQITEDAGQRAWIIAHMSPSSGDALRDQSNYFDQIVQRYKNTIAAQFYGHSHLDEFAIAYSNYSAQTSDTADSIAYLAPALTPRSANPAFRVYDVDPDTYEVMDSRTFIGDMSDPSFQTSPSWKLEYSARDTYGPAIGGWPASQPLNPAFWHKVTEAFASNEKLFQQFNSLKTRGISVVPCTGDCRTRAICNLRALRAENNCIVVTPGLNFKRADENEKQGQHDNHCEGTGLRTIFTEAAMKLRTVDADTLRKRLDVVDTIDNGL